MMKQPDWGMGTSCYEKNKAILLANWKHYHFTARKFQCTRGSLLLKQTRATELPLELAPSYQTSLICGSKSFVAEHIFSLEIVGADEGALLRESVAGEC